MMGEEMEELKSMTMRTLRRSLNLVPLHRQFEAECGDDTSIPTIDTRTFTSLNRSHQRRAGPTGGKRRKKSMETWGRRNR